MTYELTPKEKQIVKESEARLAAFIAAAKADPSIMNVSEAMKEKMSHPIGMSADGVLTPFVDPETDFEPLIEELANQFQGFVPGAPSWERPDPRFEDSVKIWMRGKVESLRYSHKSDAEIESYLKSLR
jgi:hypothetical protein